MVQYNRGSSRVHEVRKVNKCPWRIWSPWEVFTGNLDVLGTLRKMTADRKGQVTSPVNYNSNIWQLCRFYKRDVKLDKSDAICKMCCAAVKYTGNTTNPKTHVKRRRGLTMEASEVHLQLLPPWVVSKVFQVFSIHSWCIYCTHCTHTALTCYC